MPASLVSKSPPPERAAIAGPPAQVPAFDGTASIGEVGRILWHRRKMILAIWAAIVVGVFGYGLLTTKLYTATAEILVDPRDKQVVTNDVNPSTVAPDGGITQVESQASVIGSSGVLLRAIAALDLTHDPDFNGSSGLDKLIGSLRSLLGPASGPDDPQTRTLLALQRRLAIRRADKVFVIDVIVTAPNAEKAARIANAIAEAYLADQADARADAGRKASEALSGRLKELAQQVQEAENKVQAYKASNNIVVASGQLVGEQQLSDANNQLASARSRTATLRAQIDQINQLRRSGGPADATAEAMQSTVVSKLREQEGTLVQREADLQSQLGPRHPQIAAVRMQLANVRQLIAAELGRVEKAARTDYERALANERLLASNLERLKGETLSTGQASVRLREMERELDAARSVYNAFLLRAQETREAANVDTTNARIITRATPPPQKSWPPWPFLIAGALGGGLGLGAGAALVGEYLAPTILSASQIQRVTGARVVGILPGSGGLGRRRRRKAAGGDPNLRIEAVVGLVLRRLFSGDRGPHDPAKVHSVLITSAVGNGEERGRAARLLASGAWMLGERVLLVDGDVAGTRQSTSPGLLDVLRGERALDTVLHVEPGSGVALVGKGRQQPGAPEGLGAGFARRMLTEGRRYVGLAIVDGGAATENLKIAPLVTEVDHVLLVAELGVTAQKDVTAANEAMTIMGRPVTAVLLVDPVARA